MYFDAENLVADWQGGRCPVDGCQAALTTAPYNKTALPHCPDHAIRLHERTFAYYNGPERESKKAAALRNIRFNADYFGAHILNNAKKAESHRICHENSEDALTWNVFSELAAKKRLARVISTLIDRGVPEPRLYLWGLGVEPSGNSGGQCFEPLAASRGMFEVGIRRFLTEPDVILYVPYQCLILIEAKFTSCNPRASSSTEDDQPGEKPRSVEGILARYQAAQLGTVELNIGELRSPFYGQLYRNLIFAIHMAERLKVDWYLVNLVSTHQFTQKKYPDPTTFFDSILPQRYADRFRFASWEQLYAGAIANDSELQPVQAYLRRKTANTRLALAV